MKLGMIFLCLLFALVAKAETDTVLISDIDDTLKVQYVLDLPEAAKYAIDDRTRFMGMNALYQALAQDNPEMKFYYVSKAPEWLMGRTHRSFLAKGHFPKGDYYPRTEYPADTHKLQTISKIIDSEKPLNVILVGDNGEADSKVYDQLERKYINSGIRFFQYIRDVYNSPIFGGKGSLPRGTQKLFVTPIEIALELEFQGLIQHDTTEGLINELTPRIVAEAEYPRVGTIAFPYFVKCQNFVWYWDQSILVYPILQDLKAKIYKRCQLQ
ncbi:MAG: phosphatase domain-containing protein [Bacillota bacterium]